MDIAICINRFQTYMKTQRNATGATLKTYHFNLLDFIGTSQIRSLEDITIKLVDDYIEILANRKNKEGNPLSPRTIKNKLVVVRAFLEYFHNRDMTTFNPKLIDLPRLKRTEANYLTEEELAALLSVVSNKRDFAIILLIATSGLRVTELLNLTVKDIYGRSVFVENGKGQKDRVSYMTKQTRLAIDDYVSSERSGGGTILFQSQTGDSLSRMAINKMLKKYATRAGIEKNVHAHTLRHTFATLAAAKDMPIEKLRKLLGHSSIRTTQDYIHLTDNQLARTYDEKMDFVYVPGAQLKLQLTL